MALVTSTVSVAGYVLTQHVSSVSKPRGTVVYFDGDGQPHVRSTPTSALRAMAASANAAGFTFAAPHSPFSNTQWWASEGTQHAALARAYVDYAAKTYGSAQMHLMGYSGGATLLCKDLAKVGSWPSKYRGSALSLGGGSTTNEVSTPSSWRPTWPMHFHVGTRDVEGATTLSWWSAKAYAEASLKEFGAAGHPTRITYSDDDHRSYDFGAVVANWLASVAPAPTPTPAPEPVEGAPSQLEILSASLENAQNIITAAATVGVPLHIAAALIEQESNGKNIYGHDWGGVFSTNPDAVTVEGVTYAKGANVPVTASNYATFLSRVLTSDGRRNTAYTSNGVGPAQITYWGYHRDARDEGADLSDPLTNITWGLRILASYLKGSYTQASVEQSATLYNAGTLENGVNDYGRQVWVRAEKWRKALAGAAVSDPGAVTPDPAPTPTGPDPSAPPQPDPSTLVSADPGPGMRVAVSADEDVVLPDPAIGPQRVAASVAAPVGWVRWRGLWWDAVAIDVRRDLAGAVADQNPLGLRPSAATGSVTISRPTPLTDRGWNALIDSAPAPFEPVLIEMSDDDGETRYRVFTGWVDGSSGTLTDSAVQMEVVDASDRLNRLISLSAAGHRHPSPQDNDRYLTPSVHPSFVTSMAARRCGFYATPPMPRSAVVSVPMLGSMRPERGTLTLCQTVADQGDERTTFDAPSHVTTGWGHSLSNVFAVYRPHLPDGEMGWMKRTMGIRMMVDPPQDYPAFVELWWAESASIMVKVRRQHVRVETQMGYRADGWRRVLHTRTRTLKDAERASGFQLDIWLHSGGKVEIGIDGDFHVYETPLIQWPAPMVEGRLQSVRATVRPSATRIGGLIVASTSDRRDLGEWQQDHLSRIDLGTGLAGTPEIARQSAASLLAERTSATLACAWIDEDGVLREYERGVMDSLPSVRTLTEDDLESADWDLGRASLVSQVDVAYRVPTMNHRRMSSGHWMEAWEGPRDTLEPGQTWEQIISVPDSEDWIDVDRSLSELDRSTADRVNHGRGSWIGGTLVAPPDSDEEVTPGPVPTGWYSTAAWTAGPRQIGLRVTYNPPAGETRHMEMSTAEIPGMWRRFIDRGPVLRARGIQTWADRALTDPVQAASLPVWIEHEHDAGWWLQTESQARRVARRLALMLSRPIPTWQVVMAAPDLSLRIGDTVTLSLNGQTRPARICGVELSLNPDEGLTQALSLRQIHP